ncbi:ABC transporter permease [Thermodesulfobacteriota bacterium]
MMFNLNNIISFEKWLRFKRNIASYKRFPIIPVFIILCFLTISIFGEALAPHPPNKINLRARFTPPFWQDGGSIRYPLGTDQLGRDMVSRLLVGARVSCIVALLSLTFGGMIGTALGIISGYVGGKIDVIVMRVADATLSFPVILLAVLLAIALGPSLKNVVIALSIILWARYARVIRGEVLSLKELDFVTMSKIAGASKLKIMYRHIFPNIRSTFLVLLTLQVGWCILLEASLSFLGAGIPPPTPVWGSMIAKGRGYITLAWWVPLFPGLAVAICCLSFNMLGDWLREVLDPRLRQIEGGG